jgi:hypothetical protein
MVLRIEAEGEAMPKSNRASPIACAAATEPDPRAISTSSRCFCQKTHTLNDKGEQIAALSDPRQSELSRFPVLGEDEGGTAMELAARPAERSIRRRDSRRSTLVILF